jgi:hypothetical protein
MNAEQWKAKFDRLLFEPWYVVEDDVVGGWAIAMVNKPLSEILGREPVIGEMLTKELANYIVTLHNYRLGQSNG